MKVIIKKALIIIALLTASTTSAITFSIQGGEVLTSPVVISGNTELTPEWSVFEGQVGSMTIVDSSGNIMAEAPMQVDPSVFNEESQDFLATVDFNVTDTQGIIRFENNAIGDDATPASIEFEVYFEEPVKMLQIVEYQQEESDENVVSVETRQPIKDSRTWWQKFLSWIAFWKK